MTSKMPVILVGHKYVPIQLVWTVGDRNCSMIFVNWLDVQLVPEIFCNELSLGNILMYRLKKQVSPFVKRPMFVWKNRIKSSFFWPTLKSVICSKTCVCMLWTEKKAKGQTLHCIIISDCCIIKTNTSSGKMVAWTSTGGAVCKGATPLVEQ
jgi:hypothetical protein